jgi:hypothetical protein
MIEMTCLSEGPSPLDLALATRSNFRAILEDMAALLHQARRAEAEDQALEALVKWGWSARPTSRAVKRGRGPASEVHLPI